MRGLEFEYRGTETAGDRPIFDRQDTIVFLKHLMQHRFIQRLDETHIIMRRVESGGSKLPDSGGREIAGVAEAQDSDPLAVLDLSSLADLDLLEGRLPFRHDAFSAGIADHKGGFIFIELRGIEQIAQFAFIHRRADDHIGYAPHKGDIIGAMVRRSIFAHDTRPVQAKDHG